MSISKQTTLHLRYLRGAFVLTIVATLIGICFAWALNQVWQEMFTAPDEMTRYFLSVSLFLYIAPPWVWIIFYTLINISGICYLLIIFMWLKWSQHKILAPFKATARSQPNRALTRMISSIVGSFLPISILLISAQNVELGEQLSLTAIGPLFQTNLRFIWLLYSIMLPMYGVWYFKRIWTNLPSQEFEHLINTDSRRSGWFDG